MSNKRLELRTTPAHDRYDAIVVGSGPNGLAAAITLAQEDRKVLVVEAKSTVGGGMRTVEFSTPGCQHDVCSAIHALAVLSPFFRELPLEEHGLKWIYPPLPVAHPLDNGEVAVGRREIAETAELLGEDGQTYRRLFEPLVRNSDALFQDVLKPVGLPRHPLLMTRFGRQGMKSAVSLAKRFRTDKARALFAGHAAHSVMPLDMRFTGAVGVMLTVTAHAGGWPIAAGGSQSIANAMASYLVELGGEVVVDFPVVDLSKLPQSRAILCDVSPRNLASIAGESLPAGYRQRLNKFRHGPGVFKLDWVLDGPIPWRAEECSQAGTLHVGGKLEEVVVSEKDAWEGRLCERPFVLVAQQSNFDESRAPAGRHVAWGYCHVPHGSIEDRTDAIENQIERFAPGFRDRIIDRHKMSTEDFESYNANYIGGDITGGVMTLRQLLRRPVSWRRPYSTPADNIYICSASTPPERVSMVCVAIGQRTLRSVDRSATDHWPSAKK